MNDLLKSFEELDVVGGDDSTLVHAEILGQAADDCIRAGEDLTHDRPQTLAGIFFFAFDQELRIFHNTGAVDHERDGMCGKQGFNIAQMLHGNGMAARSIVAHLDTDTGNCVRILRHLCL